MTFAEKDPKSPQSLVHMFVERAEKYADRTALLVKQGTYREISWTEFYAHVRGLAIALKDAGIAHEDRVCTLSENRPEWAYADLAILSLGAVNVPIYPTSSPKEIEYILIHSEARVLVVSTEEQFAKVREACGKCPKLKRVLLMDAAETAPQGTESLKAFIRKGAEKDLKDPALYKSLLQQLKPSDMATIIYTSGTTGEPKGAMLTHANFLSNVVTCSNLLPAGDSDRSLSFLPLSHVFERMAGYYYMIYNGASIAYAENMNTVPQNLVEIRPTIVASVPRLYEKMYARVLEQVDAGSHLKQKLFYWSVGIGQKSSPYRIAGKPLPFPLNVQFAVAKALVFKKIQAKIGGRLKFFISGGAPLSKEIAEFFFSADVLILEGYGLTETSPVIAVNRPDRFRFGTVGPVIPGVQVKLAEDGEILAKGPSIMLGYFNNPQATEEAIKDGWFYTGDIGEIDADGFLIITDRKKDLIKTSGGKNVAPQKIENLIISDPYILQICVCGDRKNYLTALIVPDFAQCEKYLAERGIKLTDRRQIADHPEIIRLIRERIEERSADLANYEKIKYFTLLSEEFTQEKGELTPTLKLKRKVVTSRYAAQIESMYADKIKSPAGA